MCVSTDLFTDYTYGTQIFTEYDIHVLIHTKKYNPSTYYSLPHDPEVGPICIEHEHTHTINM